MKKIQLKTNLELLEQLNYSLEEQAIYDSFGSEYDFTYYFASDSQREEAVALLKVLFAGRKLYRDYEYEASKVTLLDYFNLLGVSDSPITGWDVIFSLENEIMGYIASLIDKDKFKKGPFNAKVCCERLKSLNSTLKKKDRSLTRDLKLLSSFSPSDTVFFDCRKKRYEKIIINGTDYHFAGHCIRPAYILYIKIMKESDIY